jgi:hypothetical protein
VGRILKGFGHVIHGLSFVDLHELSVMELLTVIHQSHGDGSGRNLARRIEREIIGRDGDDRRSCTRGAGFCCRRGLGVARRAVGIAAGERARDNEHAQRGA